jgi:hypothetical protein
VLKQKLVARTDSRFTAAVGARMHQGGCFY